MIKKNRAMLIALFLIGCLGGIFPHAAMAFSCTSNGISIGGSGTFTIPIDVTLDKTGSNIIITDMSQYTSCIGYRSYNDALMTTEAQISTALMNIGYKGNITAYGITYGLPVGQRCVWPDSSCSNQFTDGVYIPLNVKIGMARDSNVRGVGITLPAGSEIARLSVNQRSGSNWGWGKTWIFTLKKPLVIPAYVCSVTNPSQTVILPVITVNDIKASGAGNYPQSTDFKIRLECDPDTTVSLQFDGSTMLGKTDVLANLIENNANVGIQIKTDNSPIVFGRKNTIINTANNIEELSYSAYYFYSGGDVSAGEINSTSTFTLTYQ